MSLIQEALKRKTEETPAHSETARPAPPPRTPPPAAPQPAKKTPAAPPSSKTKFVIISTLIVLGLLAAIGGYFILNQPKSIEEPSSEVRTAAQSAPVTAVVPTPVPEPNRPADVSAETSPKPNVSARPTVKWPDISFSGTAAGSSETLAIINGRMLSKGSEINGITVLQIGKNKVLLEYKGEKRLFRLDE